MSRALLRAVHLLTVAACSAAGWQIAGFLHTVSAGCQLLSAIHFCPSKIGRSVMLR